MSVRTTTIEQRRLAARMAMANSRLEGLDMTPEGRADLERVVLGEITSTEAIERAKARLRKKR